MIQEQYRAVRERVEAACLRAGRDPSEVTLIAVSKTKPVSMIRELMEIGVKDFGENYAQELAEKTEEITEPLRWHFIGHLQRNKVKNVVGKACLIHSVSSLRLAEEIAKESKKRGLVTDILVEVNIGDEESKSGIAAGEAMELLKEIFPLEGIRVRGLMAIVPPVEDPEEARPYFRAMRELRDRAEEEISGIRLPELSMGMTGDFETAIEEGATFVRVGTAIFGARVYA